MTLCSPPRIAIESHVRGQIEMYILCTVTQRTSVAFGMGTLLQNYGYENHERKYKNVYTSMESAKNEICPSMKKEQFVKVMLEWLQQAPNSDKVNRFFEKTVEELKQCEAAGLLNFERTHYKM